MFRNNGNSKISMLKRNKYTQWKVKMRHQLEAIDPDYLDRINDGPYVPSKLVPVMTIDGNIFDEHKGDKPKAEWTKEEKEHVLKDAKVRNILFKSLDVVLTNYVLSCKTAIDIRNKLQVHCEGTNPVKKKYEISVDSRI